MSYRSVSCYRWSTLSRTTMSTAYFAFLLTLNMSLSVAIALTALRVGWAERPRVSRTLMTLAAVQLVPVLSLIILGLHYWDSALAFLLLFVPLQLYLSQFVGFFVLQPALIFAAAPFGEKWGEVPGAGLLMLGAWWLTFSAG